MIMNAIIGEAEEMIEETHVAATTMIIVAVDEAARDQNYHTILTNIVKGIINENITQKIIYY